MPAQGEPRSLVARGPPSFGKRGSGGSAALPNRQGPAGRRPSRPWAGIRGPGRTSWGPEGHQAWPSRKPGRGERVWGGAPGRSWAGGRSRRAQAGEKTPGEPAPDPTRNKPGSEHGRPPPTPAQGPPSPAPWNRNPTAGSWQALRSFLGRPPPAPAFRKDCFPWHPREAEVAATGPAAGPRRAGVWGRGWWGAGAGRRGDPQAPRGRGLREWGQRPFSKWAHLLCRPRKGALEPLQGRVPARAGGLQTVGQAAQLAHGLRPGGSGGLDCGSAGVSWPLPQQCPQPQTSAPA